MGRQSEAIINHFSHPHPLHLTNPQPSKICSACKQTLETEPFYTCQFQTCTTYSLHLKCSQLPYRITHPCHHNHFLSLLPKPQNPNGVFSCTACGKHGDGFLYNCKDCDVNIHVGCATLPLSLSHRSHCHQLNLVFTPPYGSNGFSCDVCGVIGGNVCWLYRCGTCGFDAHLSCATSKVQVVNGGQRSNVPDNLLLNQLTNQRDQYLQAMMAAGGGGNINNQIMQAMMGGGGGGGSVNNQILQAIMGGGGGGGSGDMSNQILQAMGGGGGGTNQIMQSMMDGGGGSVNNQILQAISGGGSGGVGGVDMSNQILQAMMGGGGGGGGNNQLLQTLMGGSGGGSGGLVQALLNGSNGGVGGLDLSSILGNVGDFGGLMGGGLGGFGF